MQFSNSTRSWRSRISKLRGESPGRRLPLKTIPDLSPPERCHECNRGQHFRCSKQVCRCEHRAYFKRWPGAENDLEVSLTMPRKTATYTRRMQARPELRPLEYCWFHDAWSVALIRDLTTHDLPFPVCDTCRASFLNHEIFILDDWKTVVRKHRIATKSSPFGRVTALSGRPYVTKGEAS